MKTSPFKKQASLLFLGFLGMTAFGLNWHWAIAAWITPVILLRYTRNSKTPGFLMFVLVAIVAGIISRTCLSVYSPVIGYIINGLFFGISYSLAYLIDRLLYKKGKGFYTTLIFPSSVVLLEYLGSLYMGTWGTVAHTQYPLNQLTQIVSITGLFGLSFLVSWFGSTMNWFYENRSNVYSKRKSVLIYVGIFLLVFIYGQMRINSFPVDSKKVKIAAITSDPGLQNVFGFDFEALKAYSEKSTGEIPERIFSDAASIDNTIENTLKAAQEGAKIIVWNEYSLILNPQQVDYLKEKVKSIAIQNNAYILIAYLEQNTTSKPKPLNNKSILIKPDGSIGWEYLKSFLIPQSEAIIINAGDFKIPFVDTEYGRLGNVICYDGDLPNLTKQAGQQSINIMLVPAYDWAEITPFHAQMSSFTAIENGVSLIRPNGSGLSAVYDYQGKLIADLNTFNSDDKLLYADVPVQSATTVFSRIGNIFVYACILFLITALGLKFFKK